MKRSGKTIVATGSLRPSSAFRERRVRIVYTQGKYPLSFVDDPRLARRREDPDTPIPHTYDSLKPGKERPCLFHPESDQWTSEMLIVDTIIPWLMSWLLDYEVWFLTGEWCGGGVHPDPKPIEPTEPPELVQT